MRRMRRLHIRNINNEPQKNRILFDQKLLGYKMSQNVGRLQWFDQFSAQKRICSLFDGVLRFLSKFEKWNILKI